MIKRGGSKAEPSWRGVKTLPHKLKAIILLKILPTPPRICKQILPSLKGRVIRSRRGFNPLPSFWMTAGGSG